MKKKIFIIITLIIVLLITVIIYLFRSNDKENVYITHDIVVQQIEELGNLEVVKYNIQDMMEYKSVRRWLPNSKISLKIVGEVIACVDLTKVKMEDIYTDKDSVRIVLPIPEICHHKVDHSKSKVYDINYGLWETATLVDEAYKSAEQHIYQQAINMGIAKESRENAIKVLTPILKGLGFNKILIEFKPTNGYVNTESSRDLLNSK